MDSAHFAQRKEEDDKLVDTDDEGEEEEARHIPPKNAKPIDIDNWSSSLKDYYMGAEACLRYKGEPELLALIVRAHDIYMNKSGRERTEEEGNKIRKVDLSGFILFSSSMTGWKLDTGISGPFGFRAKIQKVLGIL
jgi:hypothetical protein